MAESSPFYSGVRSAVASPTPVAVVASSTRLTCPQFLANGEDAMMEAAPFGVIGLNFKTASVELRNKVSLDVSASKRFIEFATRAGVPECAVLSTCNRTEIYFSGSCPDHVKILLSDFWGLDVAEFESHMYSCECVQAAEHLFAVTAGLDSAVLGETEIVAQVKDAWRLATEVGSSSGMLDLLFQRSLEASKRVRSETGLCKNMTSTGSLAVKIAEQEGVRLPDSRILVIGAGKIAERILKELKGAGATKVTVTNRTDEKAVSLAKKYGASVLQWDGYKDCLPAFDLIFGAASVTNPLFQPEALGFNPGAQRPVLVDLGVPPNFEADKASCAWHGIEEINALGTKNSEKKSLAVVEANAVLQEEIERFKTALVERAAAPTIRALVQRGDHIRKRNLAWAKEKLPEMSEKEFKVIEEMARRLTIGLLQGPIDGLKTEFTTVEHREIVERLFDLQGSEGEH